MKETIEKHLEIETLPLWIDGRRVAAQSSRTGVVTNPATGAVIRYAPMANEADVDMAVQAAQAALPAWRGTPPLRRARVLQKFLTLMQANVKELARIISEEHG